MLDDRPLHKVHPELFHYTDTGGLTGILRSQSLWGTHWQSLNDRGELQYFSSKKLPSLLKTARLAAAEEFARNREDFKPWADAQGGIENLVDSEVLGLAQAFQESVTHPDPAQRIFEYYVTSFCTPEGAPDEARTHGLLSMWRYYGKGGYSLVFDTAELDCLLRLEEKAWSSRMELGEVGYSCDSPDVLDSRITALPKFREALSKSKFDSPEAFEPMLEPLLSCSIHYKHWAFAEEREVRLTTILNGRRMLAVDAQEGTTPREREHHTQCGASRIHLFEDLGRRLPITRIIVGPGCQQPAREAELRALLEKLNLKISVALSNIPLR